MWIHAYTLLPVDSLNAKSDQKPRHGFFLKNVNIPTESNALATILRYSDFLCWPELGDPSLADLKPFLMRTAETDFNFPFSLSPSDLISITSNALVSGASKNWGPELEKLQDHKFEVLKFKLGRDFKTEYADLMRLNLSAHLVRVDFNNAFNFKDAQEALAMLKTIPNLEYAEDPMIYGHYHWSELQKIVPLGLDNYTAAEPPKHFQYRIVKPLRGFSLPQLIQWTFEKKKIVVTNMMDSAVGTWKAYLYFCQLKKHIPHHLCIPGFHTHTLYSNYPYSDLLCFSGSEWIFNNEKLNALNQTLSLLTWTRLNATDTVSLEQLLHIENPR